MSHLDPREPGVMFWAGRDDPAAIRDFGVRCGQLGFGSEQPLDEGRAAAWKSTLDAHELRVVTLFAAYAGEDYADIPTVQRTVGFIPPDTRDERVRRTLELSDFAARLGVPSIACHIGFVPEDHGDPDYAAMIDVVRRVCDRAALHGQTFALETGQEPAQVLLDFLKDVDRRNLGINFDPANLILYGTGEPIEALKLLHEQVLSVHCKDGKWPPKDGAGALGKEVPLGEGDVNIASFVATLEKLGFEGPLNIERETEDQAARLRDIAAGVQLIRGLTHQPR